VDVAHTHKETEVNNRIKTIGAAVGAASLLYLGVAGAITGGAAQAASTNANGGAGSTAVQETGKGQPATSMVISAAPLVKAIPPCGSTQNFTCGMP
jgi:hypothetical protein